MSGANTSGSKWQPFDEKKLAPTEWTISFFEEDAEEWCIVEWDGNEVESIDQWNKRMKHCADTRWRMRRADVICQGRASEGVYRGKGHPEQSVLGMTDWRLEWREHFPYWHIEKVYWHKKDVLEEFDRLMLSNSHALYRVVRSDVVRDHVPSSAQEGDPT